MSNMEFHVGTAVAVAREQKGLRNKAQWILDQHQTDILHSWDAEDDYLEVSHENFAYMSDRDELVQFQNHEENDYGVCKAQIRDDGFFRYYDFALSFHNGGTFFEEALSEAITKAEKK